MKMRSWQQFSVGLFKIEDVLKERGKDTDRKSEVGELKEELKMAKHEGDWEVTRLIDEVSRLEELLQRTVDENGMLEQQCYTEKQITMSKTIFQLQWQVSEMEGADNVVGLACVV